MADTKVSAETEVTTVAGNDAVLLITDMTGTPADKRVKVANLINGGYSTTITTGGTTTLTVASTLLQFFTSSSTQTVVLPDATTLAIGHEFWIHNNSTGVLTINANGGGLVRTLNTLNDVLLICTSTALAAGIWDGEPYMKDSSPNTLTNSLTLAAGTTTLAPLTLQPGTNMTTPADGAFEMDADCLYFTHDVGNRGVVVNTQIIRQHADRAVFATGTAQQAIFNSVTNGTLTLETGTYYFETLFQIKATSSSSGNLKFSLAGAGGATLANILYLTQAIDAAVDTLTAPSMLAEIVSTQVVTNIATATAATVTTVLVKGSFEVTVAGTIIPSVAQTTSTAAAVTTAGSYFNCNRVGATTMVSVGQWT